MSWNDSPVLPPITSIVGNQKPGPTFPSLSFFRDSTVSLPPTYPVLPHYAPAHSIVGDTHTVPLANPLESLPQHGETGSQHPARDLTEAGTCMSEYIHNDQSYGQYMHNGNTPSKAMKIVSPLIPVYRHPTATDLVPDDVATAVGVYYPPAYPMAHLPCQPVHQTHKVTAQQYFRQTQAPPPLSSKHNQEYGTPGMLDQQNQWHPLNKEYPDQGRISQPTHHQRDILSPANQNLSISTTYQSSAMNYTPMSRTSPAPSNSQIAMGPTQPPYQQTQCLSPVEIVTLSYKSRATPPPSSSILEQERKYCEMGTSQTGSYISSDVAASRSERQPSSSSSSARKTADAATTLLAEKRRKNAGASARFRDRRRQKQKEADEKIESLIAQVKELKKTAAEFSKLPELETELAKVRVERDAARERVKDLEIEIQVLRDVVQAGGFNSSATRTYRHRKWESTHSAESDPVDERTTDSEGRESGTWTRTNRRTQKHSDMVHQNTNSESNSIRRIELGSQTSISLAANASD